LGKRTDNWRPDFLICHLGVPVVFAKPRGFFPRRQVFPKMTSSLRPLVSGPRKNARSARSGSAAIRRSASANLERRPLAEVGGRGLFELSKSGLAQSRRNRGRRDLPQRPQLWPRRDRARFNLAERLADFYKKRGFARKSFGGRELRLGVSVNTRSSPLAPGSAHRFSPSKNRGSRKGGRWGSRGLGRFSVEILTDLDVPVAGRYILTDSWWTKLGSMPCGRLRLLLYPPAIFLRGPPG
jgi:hypothetical protein